MNNSAEIETLSDGIRLSITGLASEFGFSRETVKNRINKCNVKPDGRRRGNPVYRLRDCIVPITDRENGEVKDPKKLPPMERRAWYASEKDRQITEEKDGMLIPVEDHRKSLAEVIQSTVQVLETLPDVLERDCGLPADQIDMVEKIIDSERNRWADLIEEISS